MFVAIEILVVTLIVIVSAIAAVAVVFVFLFVIIIIAAVVIVDVDVVYPCTICLLCLPRFILLCLKTFFGNSQLEGRRFEPRYIKNLYRLYCPDNKVGLPVKNQVDGCHTE